MSIASHQQLVATSGNYPISDKVGEKLYLGSGYYNVEVGRAVLWDPKCNKIVGKDSIGVLPEIKFSIGIGDTEGGPATGVFTIGKDEYAFCKDRLNVSFTPACCGSGQVTDIAIAGCLKPNTNYGIELHVRTPWTKFMHGSDGETIYPFYVDTTQNAGCTEDCDPSVTCYEVACKLVNKINSFKGKSEIPGAKIQIDNAEAYYQPFHAVVIPSDKKVYHACLSLEKEGDCCKTCAYFPEVKELIVPICTLDADGNEAVEDCVIPLSLFAASGKTTPEQMKTMQDFINNNYLHKVGAHAQLSHGIGKCCQYRLTIAGCVAAEPTLSGAGDPKFVAECPFKTKQFEDACKACGTAKSEKTPGCKIRIFMDSITLPCKCNLPAGLDFSAPDALRSEIMDVQFTSHNKTGKEGWVDGYVWSEEIEKYVEPEGYGYGYMYKYLKFPHEGGEGGFNEYGGEYYGDFQNRTMPGYQLGHNNNNLIKCNETYCAMNLCFLKEGMEYHINAMKYYNLEYTQLLIPTEDRKTYDSIKEVLECLAGLDKCSVFGEGCFGEDSEEEATDCGCGSGFMPGCVTCEEQLEALTAESEETTTDVHGNVLGDSGDAKLDAAVAKSLEAKNGVEVATAKLDSAKIKVADKEAKIKEETENAAKLEGKEQRKAKTRLKTAEKALVKLQEKEKEAASVLEAATKIQADANAAVTAAQA